MKTNVRELCKIFYRNLHVYNSLVKYELDDVGYASETKDITLNAITNIEKVAQELDLYGDEWQTDIDYVNKYIIPRLKEFFRKNTGDDKMNSNNPTLEEMKKNDEMKIREHFKNNTIDWRFDDDIEMWINDMTGQSIREYLLKNVQTNLSPSMFKDFVAQILWQENFYEILDELSDMELLTTLATQKPNDNGNHLIYLIKEEVEITPKQWRQIVAAATERFVMRDE